MVGNGRLLLSVNKPSRCITRNWAHVVKVFLPQRHCPQTVELRKFAWVISGKGGHAAIPQHTIDPIVAASNVIVSLQQLVSREADPLDSQAGVLCVSYSPLSGLSSLSEFEIPSTLSL